MTVVLNGLGDFSLTNLKRIAWQGEPVAIGAEALALMRRRRQEFLALVEASPETPIYGVTSGFGDRAAVMLNAEERQAQATMPPLLQGAGVGRPLPERVVRAMILGRLINFVSGYAAVSLETAQGVAAMLDGRPLPVVRIAGQDSPGELLQLFNLFHDFMGPMSGLRDQNALRNGSACAPGLAGDLALRAARRARLATQVFALSIDAGNMGLAPYDPALKALLRDPFEAAAIDRLQGLLAGHQEEGRRSYQAPISWRILTRLLGQMLRVLDQVEAAADELLSTVNDNPVFLGPDEAPPLGRCITTGGFHVPRAYHAMNWQAQIWADLAPVAARQVEQLHRHAATGLPERLWVGEKRYSTLFLGMTAKDLAARAQAAASPALIPLYGGNDGQTDTAMPLFRAYEAEGEAAYWLDRILAILAASASQALAVAERQPAPPLRPFLAGLRARFPVVESARDLGGDVESLAEAFAAAVLERPEAGALGERLDGSQDLP